MEREEIPEHAIRVAEKDMALRIVVHDWTATLWPFLPPTRLLHRSRYCTAVKETPFLDRCIAFEVYRLRREIDRVPEGRIQCCHAGFVEWVAPVRVGGETRCVVFAGQRRPGRSLRLDARDAPPSPLPTALRHRSLPAPVEQAEGEALLERLIQLAARLANWLAEQPVIGARETAAVRQATRAERIRHFIHLRHVDPIGIADLAHLLRLSESRAAHVVRELFGGTLQELVTQARLRTAASLLRHTSLSVAEVALQSGMGDPSHFHRAFKRTMGMTPSAYRRYGEGPRPPAYTHAPRASKD